MPRSFNSPSALCLAWAASSLACPAFPASVALARPTSADALTLSINPMDASWFEPVLAGSVQLPLRWSRLRRSTVPIGFTTERASSMVDHARATPAAAPGSIDEEEDTVSPRRISTRAHGPDAAHELSLLSLGFERVTGLDEVGRGAWAGPVSVGVVVFPSEGDPPEGVRDSKEI